MTNQEKVALFRQITQEMADLYEKKNNNYGDSFGNCYRDLGPVSGLVPLHNKLDRLTSLVKGNPNNFESIEDSFIDLANYAIMNLIEIRAARHRQTSTHTGEDKEDETYDSLSEYTNREYNNYYKEQMRIIKEFLEQVNAPKIKVFYED